MKKIKIKYFSEDYPRLEKIPVGDWVDLRIDSIKDWDIKAYGSEFDAVRKIKESQPEKFQKVMQEQFLETPMDYSGGDTILIGLGVAMELPQGYEAYVVPRSSLFKNTGLLLTNGVGIIDNSYCGNNDEWMAMLYATRDGEIKRHDRLLQFRIQENQPRLEFEEAEELENENRGGYGSTGKK